MRSFWRCSPLRTWQFPIAPLRCFPLFFCQILWDISETRKKELANFLPFPPLICHNWLNADFPEQGLKGRRFNCPQFCDAKNTGNMSQVTKCYTYGRDMTNINPETSNQPIFMKCQIESAFRSTNLFLIGMPCPFIFSFLLTSTIWQGKVKN